MGDRVGVDEFGEPTYANETITPEQAKEYHELYVRNRPIRWTKVGQYREAMLASKGKWWLTGETIIFGWNGVPLNGDHRFLACMEANVPFRTAVARGVDPEAFQAIDSGAVRQFADDLALQGVPNAKNAGGLLRKIACWNYHKELDAVKRGVEFDKGHGSLLNLPSFHISRPELHEMWPAYAKEILAALQNTQKWHDNFPGDRGAMLFVYWLLTKEENNPEVIERYFGILTNGTEELYANNVLLKLREKLSGMRISAEMAAKMKGHRQEWHVYWMLQNWTRWVRMSRLPSFTLRGPGGTLASPFPQPQRVR